MPRSRTAARLAALVACATFTLACVPARRTGGREVSGGLLPPGTIAIVNGRGDSLVLGKKRPFGRGPDAPPPIPPPLPWPLAASLMRAMAP